MSFMSTKVLGQFDPFWNGPMVRAAGCCSSRPTSSTAERQLGVDPHDFRLWVCLHEETHRVQFTAVPWMREHMRSLLDEFIDATDLDSGALSSMVGDSFSEVVKIVRGESTPRSTSCSRTRASARSSTS